MDQQDDLQRFRPLLKALADDLLYYDLRKKVDPSDVVQQTMVEAIKSRSQFRGDSDAAKAGWLKAILRNVVHGLLRRYHRDRRNMSLEQSLDNSMHSSLGIQLVDTVESPSFRERMEEDKRWIQETMALLNEQQRRAMVMRYWQDMSLEEIGKAMDKKPEAVASLLYRAMKIIRSKSV